MQVMDLICCSYEALHLRFHTPQARRRNMAMDTDSKDKLCDIKSELVRMGFMHFNISCFVAMPLAGI